MSRYLPVTAIAQSEECANELRAVASEISDVRFDVRLVRHAEIVPTAEAAVGSVLVVECRADDHSDRQRLATLVKPDGPPVIVVVRSTSLATVRELMRLGMTDVVPQPIAKADMEQALTHARAALDAKPEVGGRILSVMRSCGGVGATALAIQMAIELAQRDKAHKTRVCLIDFDLQFGNVELSLDLGHSPGLGQILDAPTRLDPAFLGSAVVHHDSGIDVLAAPGEIVPFEALSVDMVGKILGLARAQYDFVVLDLPHAWASWTPTVLAASSLAVLVMRPDVTSVQRARRHLKLMTEEQLGDLPKLIVANRVDRRWGSGWRAGLREVEGALGQPIGATVANDYKTVQAAREQGVPLRAISRNSPIEKDMRELVRLALSAMGADDAPAATPASGAAGFAGFSLRPRKAVS